MIWNEFVDKIVMILGSLSSRLELSYDEEGIKYSIASKEYAYTKDEYDKLYNSTMEYNFNPYSLNNKNSYESLIEIQDVDSRRMFSLRLEDKLNSFKKEDKEKGIIYEIGPISDELIWFILKEYDRGMILNRRFPSSFIEKRLLETELTNLFDIIRQVLRLPLSMYVKSSINISLEKLIAYRNSFLFNIAYNIDIVFMPIVHVDTLFTLRGNLNKRRISNIDEIMPPKLQYKHALTEQYYMALNSSDPFVKFIGFYHIMEYFYEEVYNDDILINIQQIIQHPGFSILRKKDLAKIVDLVRKKTRINKEEFQGTQLEALELTLKKNINIIVLRDDLYNYDNDLIEYYKNHQVRFSDGDVIDLNDVTNDKLFKKIAARIYKTRNSLVHSKSNDGTLKERGVYQPFKDSAELLKEIPLMRYLAETIIINSATNL